MSPVGFAIIFGNENGASWKEFWRFIHRTHPTMNMPDVTIVTDQDKGIMGAIAEVMTDCGHFFCAWHRRQRLTECRSVDHFDHLCERYFPLMNPKPKDLQYLNKVNDASQYAVK
jgi:hypothetical protein